VAFLVPRRDEVEVDPCITMTFVTVGERLVRAAEGRDGAATVILSDLDGAAQAFATESTDFAKLRARISPPPVDGGTTP